MRHSACTACLIPLLIAVLQHAENQVNISSLYCSANKLVACYRYRCIQFDQKSFSLCLQCVLKVYIHFSFFFMCYKEACLVWNAAYFFDRFILIWWDIVESVFTLLPLIMEVVDLVSSMVWCFSSYQSSVTSYILMTFGLSVTSQFSYATNNQVM